MTIEVDHIYKAFDGVSILKDITMQIADGDSIVITGMSGIGKTTFIRILWDSKRRIRAVYVY